MFETTLSQEYADLARAYGLDQRTLVAVALQSVHDSFAEPELKRALTAHIRSFANARACLPGL